MLALGIPVSGLQDMCGISEAVLSKFIDKWEPWFIKEYQYVWVKMPEGEELDKTQAMLGNCGLAGFIFSMDVVHIKYDRCP